MIKNRFILSIFMIQLLSGCTTNNSTESFINIDNLPIAYIDNTEGNLFYVGIQKKISIHIINDKKINIKVKIDNGNIKEDGLNYFITPMRQGILNVSIYSGNNFLVAYRFKVKLTPNPFAKLDNANFSSQISPGTIQNSKAIKIELDNFDYKVSYEVVSYKMIRITPDGKKTEIQNSGVYFNTIIRDELKKSLPGDVIIFDDVKVRSDADDYLRRISNVTYFVN